AHCVVFLDQSKALPFSGQPCAIRDEDLQRTECILSDFIDERAQRGRAFRDSMLIESKGMLRSESFQRPRSEYYRQYAAECTAEGDTLIYLNAFCHVSGPWREGWWRVDDGGDCFFQVKFDLTHR